MIPCHIHTDYPAEDWQRDPESRNWRLPVAVALGAAAVLSRRLLPYERIAMSRAIAEADAKRGAA